MTEFKDNMVCNVLVSCYDKTGLKYFASELVRLNPDVKIYCSSGTYSELKKAVGAEGLIGISEYTGVQEMPSGLVKTLHPKVHAGILADLNDERHRKYLEENRAVAFDLVIVNLYPFAKEDRIEKARMNIDVGGASLIEAACKNFLRVAVVVSPVDYERLLETIRKNGGVNIETRLQFAKTAMNYLSSYLANIDDYFQKISTASIKKEYGLEK